MAWPASGGGGAPLRWASAHAWQAVPALLAWRGEAAGGGQAPFRAGANARGTGSDRREVGLRLDGRLLVAQPLVEERVELGLAEPPPLALAPPDDARLARLELALLLEGVRGARVARRRVGPLAVVDLIRRLALSSLLLVVNKSYQLLLAFCIQVIFVVAYRELGPYW